MQRMAQVEFKGIESDRVRLAQYVCDAQNRARGENPDLVEMNADDYSALMKFVPLGVAVAGAYRSNGALVRIGVDLSRGRVRFVWREADAQD